MPEALKTLMQPRAHGTTQPPAAPQPAPVAQQPVLADPAAPSEAAIRAQVQADEQTRRAGITAAFGGFASAHAELMNACLLDMQCTAEQAKDKLLAKLGEGTTPSAAAQNPAAHIHAGNGNIHVNLLLDPDQPGELARALACLDEVFTLALGFGGTLSGEHGVGLEKRDYVAREIDAPTLGVMAALKHALDPHGILNPGKALPEFAPASVPASDVESVGTPAGGQD